MRFRSCRLQFLRTEPNEGAKQHADPFLLLETGDVELPPRLFSPDVALLHSLSLSVILAASEQGSSAFEVIQCGGSADTISIEKCMSSQ